MPKGLRLHFIRLEPAADHIVKPVDVVETEEIVEEPEESKEVNDESEVISVNPFAEIERGFKELFSKYKADRSVYTQELEKQKEENYKEKSLLLEKLKAIVEDQEDLSRIYPAFKEIQTKWRAIGPVPQAKAKDLYENYRHYAEKFYDYVKINREFRDLDFRKNLEAKEQLCERAEALENDENVVESFRLLQKLHEEWKEIGPVSREQREAIWGRFKLATANINKKHQGYFESQKGDQKENLEKKTALCEKVEEIAAKEIKDSNAWNTLSKNIEEIQNEWKKIGFASKKENQKIYDRFRAACDKFYSLNREFYSAFKDQMQENMEKKVALCEQAEALKESEEWKKTADMLINIQKQWKEIGPVSRKKSEQIWKRFRAACDAFFDNREKHFGEQDNQYEDNLSKKQSLVEEIKAFVPSAEKNENIESLKGFQSRWNEIGFVPFKEKEKIQTAYNQAIEEKFGDIRPDDGGDRVARYKRRYGDNNRNRNTGTHSERERLIQKYSKMEQDIATWENNMGFFSKSKNAEAMLEDMKKKVDQAKEELAELEQKIHSLDNQNEE